MPRRTARILLSLPLAVAACARNEYQPPPPPPVTVATPSVRDVIEYAEFTGTTEPVEIVEIRARVEGILQEITYREGSRVESGELLFRIDPASFQARRDAAAARVASAKAQAGLASTTAERMERASADEAVSELQALEARAQADVADAMVEVAEKDLAIQELDLSHTLVRAPIAGHVARSNYKEGSLVGNLTGAALTTITDDADVYAWFTVPDRVLLRQPRRAERFPPIQLATEGDTDWPHEGRVDYFDPTVDPDTGTLRVRARFPNPERRLVGGLFVRCRIEVQKLDGALLIPEAAIGTDQVGRFVYVVGTDDIVERRAVRTGPRDGGDRVILDGVTAADRVIVDGLLRARPGKPVTVSPRADA